MKTGRAGKMRQWAARAVMAFLPVMVGCSNFFTPVVNSGGGGGGGTTTNNSVYVGNVITSSLSGFAISTTGTLTSIANLPVKLSVQPVSMAVTPNNSFLYISTFSGIYLYVINSDGTLTASSANPIPAGVYATSIAISPDGNWLIALDGTTQQLDIFSVNTITGALTSATVNPTATYSILSGTWTPTTVIFSPNAQFIYAALGTGGDAIFTFNTSTGATVGNGILQTPTTTTSDFGLAVDSTSTRLFIARSGTQGGIAVYNIGSSGALSTAAGSPFPAGTGTYALVISGTTLYAANRGDGTISAYTIGTTPILTPVSSSPYASGIGVQALALDRTGKYLLAVSPGGSPDLAMYSFDATTAGQLNRVASIQTDTAQNPAGASSLALTH